ncbi:MAG: hypothetical protein ABIR70_15940 [Bryobacteraceae bacterium]
MGRLLSFLLCLALPIWAQDPTALQLRVVQSEGAVYAAGSRATRGVIVEVTDETGNAVAGATVTFRLPDRGPSGQFASGNRTEIVSTGDDGRAEAWGMQWGSEAGALELRITAAKGATRGGVICGLFLSDAPVLKSSLQPAPQKASGSKKKIWITLALAAAAGVAVIGVAGSQVPTAISPGTIESVAIGSPSIVIGRP